MNTSVPINEYIVYDDLTPQEIVDFKITDLVTSDAVPGDYAVLEREAPGHLWRMTYQSAFDAACGLLDWMERTNPFLSPFVNELQDDLPPDEREWKETYGDDWTRSTASLVADELVMNGNDVFTDNGTARGIDNCSTLILHKKTLALAGVARAVNELVLEIGKEQDDVRRRTGVVLAPVQVFIHEGNIETLEILGRPSVPLRLV